MVVVCAGVYHLSTRTTVLISHRGSAYARWPLVRRQLCWEHLRWEFVAFTGRDDAATRLGRAFLRDTTQIFAAPEPGEQNTR